MINYPFRAIEELKEPPYTEIKGEYALKMRNVYCQNCHYTTTINIYGAKCGQCKSFLIESPRLSNINA